jgi:hypothetical protein
MKPTTALSDPTNMATTGSIPMIAMSISKTRQPPNPASAPAVMSFASEVLRISELGKSDSEP